jgi:hypothetical protein
MTQLTASFKHLVEKLTAEQPDVAARTIFLDLRDGVAIDATHRPDAERAEKLLQHVGVKSKKKGSHAHIIDDGLFYLALADKDDSAFSKNDARNRTFSLYHEFGHLVMPRGIYDPRYFCEVPLDMVRNAELAADSYGMLSWLQNHGYKNIDLGHLGFYRSIEMMNAMGQYYKDFSDHFTTIAVDRIAIDSTTADFSSLTPDDKIKIADEYARGAQLPEHAYREMERNLYDVKVEWRNLSNDNKKALVLLVDATLAAKDDSLTYYTGARLLAGFLSEPPHGEVLRKYGHMTFDEPFWVDAKKQLQEKAERLGKAGQFLHIRKKTAAPAP